MSANRDLEVTWMSQMFFRVMFMMAILAPGVFLTGHANAAPPRLSVSGLGPVKIGMTIEEARQVSSVRETSVSGTCRRWEWKRIPSDTTEMFATRGTKLDLIIVRTEGIRTTRGISLGHALWYVKRKYPNLRRIKHRRDPSRVLYSVNGRSPYGRGTSLVISFTNFKVDTMYSGTRTQVRWFLEC